MPHSCVAALVAESSPIVRRLQSPRPLSHRLVSGTLAGCEVAVLTCGVGPSKAFERTTAALARWPADGVLSFGTCGALVDAFGVGSVVTAETLLAEQDPCAPPLPWPAAARVCLTTVDRPVFEASWRDELAGIGAQACEMEAAAVQRAAGSRVFATLKVVSDMAAS